MGLSPTHSFDVQVTWLTERRQIGLTRRSHASIACAVDHRSINQTCASLRRVITVGFSATWRHHTRRSRGTGSSTTSTHVLNRKRYNGPDQISQEASGSSDEDPTDAIQGVLQRILGDQIRTVDQDRTATT